MMTRIDQLVANLVSRNIDAALISKKESIQYYSNLSPLHPTEREAYLLISPTKTLIYHSPFVTPPKNLPHLSMSSINPLSLTFANFFSNSHTIGIEKTNLTVAESDSLRQIAPKANLQAIDNLISTQRQIKDNLEIKTLKKSGQIAAKTIKYFHNWLNHDPAIGISEIELANQIDHHLRQLGANDSAFPTIVAFDQHSAKPHHVPTSAKLKPNSIILIDMGASLNSYKSDLTRTWQRGNQTTPLFKKIKTIVDTAYLKATQAAFLNTPASNLDAAARSHIANHGYQEQFIHTTGHGIGLEAHELPHVSASDTTKIKSGTVFTIEPGIYLSGKFGYRHENTFVMTKDGAVSITS